MKEIDSIICACGIFKSTNNMNLYIVLQVIIGAAVVIARPVDVNNDDRPLINYISPHQIDDLVIAMKPFSTLTVV